MDLPAVCVIPRMANFEPEYAVKNGVPRFPAEEEAPNRRRGFIPAVTIFEQKALRTYQSPSASLFDHLKGGVLIAKKGSSYVYSIDCINLFYGS